MQTVMFISTLSLTSLFFPGSALTLFNMCLPAGDIIWVWEVCWIGRQMPVTVVRSGGPLQEILLPDRLNRGVLPWMNRGRCDLKSKQIV